MAVAFLVNVSRYPSSIEATFIHKLCRACFCAVAAVAAFFILPKETPVGGSMDWLGSVLGLSGMVLFNFAWK
jgi:hypothetical protein